MRPDSSTDDERRPRRVDTRHFTRLERRLTWTACGLMGTGLIADLLGAATGDKGLIFWGAGISVVGLMLLVLAMSRCFAGQRASAERSRAALGSGRRER